MMPKTRSRGEASCASRRSSDNAKTIGIRVRWFGVLTGPIERLTVRRTFHPMRPVYPRVRSTTTAPLMKSSRTAMLALRLVMAVAASGLLGASTAVAQAPTLPDALTTGEPASKPTPASIADTLNQAKAAFDRGNYVEAFSRYRKVLLADGGNGPALYGLANTLAAMGRYFEAERQYRRYVEGPGQNDPNGHLGLGRVQVRLKTPNLAERSFRRALQYDPSSTVAMINLAVTLRSLHKDDEALALVRRALAIRPDDHTALHALARVQFQRDQLPAGIVAIREAIDIVRRLHLADRAAVAHLLRLQRYHRDLFEALRVQVQRTPGDAQALRELSIVRRQTADGDRDLRYYDALHDIVRAAALAPNDVPILEQLAGLQIHLHLNEVAVETCRKIVEIDADHAAAKQWLEQLASNPSSPTP